MLGAGPLDSAVRVFGIWAASTGLVVWLSADFTRRKSSEIPIWLGLVVALASNLSMLAALMAAFPLFLEMYPDRRAPLGVAIAFAPLGLAFMWANSVFVQVLQNIGYRAMGAEQQPIRWYRGHRPKHRRRSR